MIKDIIYLLGLAMLSIMIAYQGSLATQLKRVLKMDESGREYIKPLSNPKFWKMLHWSLQPLAIPMFIYIKLGELLSCPYCISTWAGFLFGILTKNNILISLCYSGLCIIGVFLIEKLFIKCPAQQ
jgi:hypothetical protein